MELRLSHNRKSGQMLVVLVLMITTVIIMFGMTVSVGHLVQARINLQNSVDLSAMSAASYQARYMNAASIANYRTRAVVRFFLLDSYVTQARFNTRFQNQVLGGGGGTLQEPIDYTLSVCQQARGYSPTLPQEGGGRGSDQSENVCQNMDVSAQPITPLIPSPIPGFNPIYILINLTLLAIAEEFRSACGEWRGQNRGWATWAMQRVKNDADEQADQMNRVLSGFSSDMGANPGGGEGGADTSLGRAGLTAVSTFGSNLVGAHPPNLSALYYIGDQGSRTLGPGDMQLNTQRMGLNFVEPEWTSGCLIAPSPGGQFQTAQDVPQGFSKRDPSGGSGGGGGKTISLGMLGSSGAPKILFWPQGLEPAMVALAAAKPFGSRIGPPNSYFRAEGSGGSGWGNMTLFPGDDASSLTTGGVGNVDILRAAFGTLPDPGSGVASSRPNQSMAGLAYAPTIYDSLYYSIFNPGSEYLPVDVLPPFGFTGRLEDRGGEMPEPRPSQFNGLPYYNRSAITSAWAPPGNAPRSGYQIKLISIEELCQTAPDPYLAPICGRGENTL